MKLDLANFKLSQLKPHLKQQIIPYEQAKFKALVDGGLELKVTREWLKGICETANATATTRNPEQINLPENKPKMNEVFVDAMLSLLSSSVAVIGEKCPETLRLDESRIVKMQNELQAIAIVASLLMLMKTTFVELRRNMTELKKMRDILLLLLQDPSTTISHLQVQLLDSVKTVKGSVTSEEEKLLNTMVDKTLSFKDTVYIMVQRRIIGVIRSYVLTGKFKPEILPRQGLDLVANELAQLADKFILLVEHNRQVHAPWYDEIINEFIQ
ncbi:hypothetical protein ROZALSC1DRAFT_30112 [Rozella allomycis CSF55]|uniref:T-complex 11 domain-containing protein n=1 Tax=Rozella allomycis (strain CSF55) TaxID=988480 RepID=A0A075B1P8_ROZAC|nr:T-complex 11 domain-containing protein [Rozella allomycis CSF55]RKP18165.1 hypothetical protein ROZALSC1DRAFT_30112 [Rozella allomycis CSF55]|eukprot:EPZ36507.1 T-complex 11 domain-containing protein [Rozella allomycis CSF55]